MKTHAKFVPFQTQGNPISGNQGYKVYIRVDSIMTFDEARGYITTADSTSFWVDTTHPETARSFTILKEITQ